MERQRKADQPCRAIPEEQLAKLRVAQERELARMAESNARDERRYKWVVRMGVAGAVGGMICVLLVVTSLAAKFPCAPTSGLYLRGVMSALGLFATMVLVAVRWPRPKPSAGMARTNLLTKRTGADHESLGSQMHDMALQEPDGLKGLRAAAGKAVSPISPLSPEKAVLSDFDPSNKPKS